jgi:hypothetical protein
VRHVRIGFIGGGGGSGSPLKGRSLLAWEKFKFEMGLTAGRFLLPF